MELTMELATGVAIWLATVSAVGAVIWLATVPAMGSAMWLVATVPAVWLAAGAVDSLPTVRAKAAVKARRAVRMTQPSTMAAIRRRLSGAVWGRASGL